QHWHGGLIDITEGFLQTVQGCYQSPGLVAEFLHCFGGQFQGEVLVVGRTDCLHHEICPICAAGSLTVSGITFENYLIFIRLLLPNQMVRAANSSTGESATPRQKGKPQAEGKFRRSSRMSAVCPC